MRRWWLVLALLASLGVNLGLVAVQVVRARAVATPPGPGPEPGGPDPGGRLADHLRLEGEERQRFLGLQRELAKVLREERGEIVRLRRELRAELVAPAPDRARVDRLLVEIGGRQTALDRAFADNVLESRRQLAGPALDAYLRFVERFNPGRPGAGGEPLRERLEALRGGRRGPPGRQGPPPAEPAGEVPRRP